MVIVLMVFDYPLNIIAEIVNIEELTFVLVANIFGDQFEQFEELKDS